jgi:mannose-6-phosphate isomerase
VPPHPAAHAKAGYSSSVAKEDWLSAVNRVEKPWGFEEHFALVPGKYCGKALHVQAGCALSLQYHEQKEETVAVQSGRLLFEVGGPEGPLESFELLPGEAIHILPGTRHRMTALVDTVVLEASTTELDDVVRMEDRYGREAAP